MAGSLHAAESRNGRTAARSDRLRRSPLSRFRLMSGLAVSVALAACSAAPPPPAPPVAVAPDTTRTAEAPAAPEAPTAEPAVARVPELPALTGMGPAELAALLGEPDFRRSEPPAELWQYRSADCVLDVFLYADGDGYRVLRSATRDRHAAPTTIERCKAVFDRQSRQSGL
jgi:hypothetical protein